MDGNTYALNKHLAEIEALELYQESIEIMAEEIGIELLGQHLVKINGDAHLYHIDDFIADDVFNTGSICSFLLTSSRDLHDELTEKFEAWCEELATKDIDNEEQPCEY